MNTNHDKFDDLKLKMKSEKGYNYLKKLASNLKIINKNKVKKLDYDEITKALRDKNIVKNNKNNIIETNSNKSELFNDNLDKNCFYSVDYYEEKEKEKGFSEEKRFFTHSNINNFAKQFSLNLVNTIEEPFDKLNLKKVYSDKKIKRKSNGKIKDYANSNVNKFKNLSNIIKLDKSKKCELADKINNLNQSEKEILLDKKSSIYKCKENTDKEDSNKGRKISSFNSNKTLTYNEVSNSSNNNTSNSRTNSIFNYNDKSNNLTFVNAADSFKSFRENSFKIQLQSIEDGRRVSYLSSKTNDENKNIEETPNEEMQIFKNEQTKSRLNIYTDNNQLDTLYTFKEKLSHQNSFGNRKKRKSKTLKDDTAKIKVDKIDNSKIQLMRKVSSCYFDSSDSYTDDSKLESNLNLEKNTKQKKNSQLKNKERSKSKNYFKIKEINFLNSIEIKKRKNKEKENSMREKVDKKKNKYLHSTDTSSFIQFKKIKNEEIYNSKEKCNQSKLINLITNDNYAEENLIGNDRNSNNNNDYKYDNFTNLINDDILYVSKFRSSNQIENKSKKTLSKTKLVLFSDNNSFNEFNLKSSVNCKHFEIKKNNSYSKIYKIKNSKNDYFQDNYNQNVKNKYNKNSLIKSLNIKEPSINIKINSEDNLNKHKNKKHNVNEKQTIYLNSDLSNKKINTNSCTKGNVFQKKLNTLKNNFSFNNEYLQETPKDKKFNQNKNLIKNSFISNTHQYKSINNLDNFNIFGNTNYHWKDYHTKRNAESKDSCKYFKPEKEFKIKLHECLSSKINNKSIFYD